MWVLSGWLDAPILADALSAILRPMIGIGISGVVVGGVIAGNSREKRLGSLYATRLRRAPTPKWKPRKLAYRPLVYNGPAYMRPIVRSLDRLVFLMAVRLVAAAERILNTLIKLLDRLLMIVLAIVSAVLTLVRRLCRRVASTAIEILLVALDGIRATYAMLLTFLRHVAIPLALMLVLAEASARFAQTLDAYVGSGDLMSVPVFVLLALVSLAAAAGIVASQAGELAVNALDALARGLMAPFIGGLIFFVVMSLGLALAGETIPGRPYSIGPITIGAALLLVVAVAYSLLQSNRSEIEVVSDEDSPLIIQTASGTTLAVAPVIGAFVLVSVVLAGLAIQATWFGAR